jgi:hypothetical protein
MAMELFAKLCEPVEFDELQENLTLFYANMHNYGVDSTLFLAANWLMQKDWDVKRLARTEEELRAEILRLKERKIRRKLRMKSLTKRTTTTIRISGSRT